MQIKNTSEQYGVIAIIFHWILAVIVIGLLCLGLYMTSLESSPEKINLFIIHKEFGILVLMLTGLRIVWRAINITPSLNIPRWEKATALTVHWLLYGFILAMPLTGWLLSSAANRPVSFFGLALPNLIAPNDHLRHFFAETHGLLAYMLIALVVLHTLASFKHHFYNKDNILRRIIWP